MSGSPRVRLVPVEVPIPGIAYGELELIRNTAAIAPFQASRFSLAPGAATDPDEHAVRECWMVARGEGTLTHEGHSLTIRAGEVLWFDSDERHRVENTGAEELVIFSVWWPR